MGANLSCTPRRPERPSDDLGLPGMRRGDASWEGYQDSSIEQMLRDREVREASPVALAEAISKSEQELAEKMKEAIQAMLALDATKRKLEEERRAMLKGGPDEQRPLPSMGTVYFMIFTILLSCGTYTYSLPVLTPPAAAVLAPDSAAETASNMYGLALLSVIFVPFCNDIIDRHGDVGAVVQVLAASGVASSAFFLLAFQMESITMLWVGTVVAGAGSQISLNGATAAMAAIFISVDPARAGMINAMYMGGMLTAMPLGALAASLFPLTSYDPRTGETVVDTTVYTIHLILGMIGWVMFLNVPKHLFRMRVYQGVAATKVQFSMRKTVVSTLRSLCEVLVSKSYRGLLLSCLAGGISLGMVNGVTATLEYFAEDHIGMKGEDVQQVYGFLFALGALGAAALVVPYGFFIDRFGSLLFIYTGSLVLAGEFAAMLLLPPAEWMVLGYWASFFSLFTLYMTALYPYLITRVFPSQQTIGRDIGIWNALGSPGVVGVTVSQGAILAAAGTTGRKMLANLEQYLLEGYNNCWISAIAVFVAFPLIIHIIGSCNPPRAGSSTLL